MMILLRDLRLCLAHFLSDNYMVTNIKLRVVCMLKEVTTWLICGRIASYTRSKTENLEWLLREVCFCNNR